MRKEFEKWAQSEGLSIGYCIPEKHYWLDETNYAWKAWQASKKDIVEVSNDLLYWAKTTLKILSKEHSYLPALEHCALKLSTVLETGNGK